MTVYQKVAGVWQPASVVYIKVNGVQTLVDDAYVKVAGTWRNAHHYDVTPPPPPEIVASIVDLSKGSYISLGVRMPGMSNRTDIRRIRVLTTYAGDFPTSQFGGTFTPQAADGWPGEPWSEWRYNSFGDHNDTSIITYKKWPRNAAATSYLVAGRDYHFSAWAEDFYGNWSAVTSIKVVGPKKGVDSANISRKVARFQPQSGGVYNGSSFVSGELVQSASPYRFGIYFYGHQISEAIGQNGTPNVTGGQILVSRYDDPGSASANVYLYWHSYPTAGDLTFPMTRHETTKLGTIAKGESKWFSLPTTFLNDLEGNTLKGFGFFNQDPAKASAFADDYSELKAVTDAQRAGEVVISWTEAL